MLAQKIKLLSDDVPTIYLKDGKIYYGYLFIACNEIFIDNTSHYLYPNPEITIDEKTFDKAIIDGKEYTSFHELLNYIYITSTDYTTYTLSQIHITISQLNLCIPFYWTRQYKYPHNCCIINEFKYGNEKIELFCFNNFAEISHIRLTESNGTIHDRLRLDDTVEILKNKYPKYIPIQNIYDLARIKHLGIELIKEDRMLKTYRLTEYIYEGDMEIYTEITFNNNIIYTIEKYTLLKRHKISIELTIEELITYNKLTEY